jgi:hypothetical protein
MMGKSVLGTYKIMMGKIVLGNYKIMMGKIVLGNYKIMMGKIVLKCFSFNFLTLQLAGSNCPFLCPFLFHSQTFME